MQAGSDDRPGDRRGFNIIARESKSEKGSMQVAYITRGQFINMSLKPGEDKMSEVRNGKSRFIIHAFTYV
jgi:CRISPR/Cas system-associated protein endoribonuclease Cas2